MTDSVAQKILEDLRARGCTLDLTAGPECPLSLRVRFPAGTPDGFKDAAVPLVNRYKHEIGVLVAAETEEGPGPDAGAATGRTGGACGYTGAD